MATKDQKIKQLEERAGLAEDKVDGLTEIAGDLFIGLVTAVDLLQEQKAMLEIDSVILEAAQTVIGRKNDEINRLESAERKRQREEADKQRDADHLKSLRDRPAMANWVLINTKAMVDGMLLATEPSRYDRRRNVVVEIDRYGNDGATTTTTTGGATVTFNVPVFGPQSAYATIENVVTGEKPDSKEVTVRNTIEFNFEIGGKKRTIKIVSGGKIREGCSTYVDEEFTQVLVGSDTYYSVWAEKYRGSDAKDAVVSTSPMLSEQRRSSGCGGY